MATADAKISEIDGGILQYKSDDDIGTQSRIQYLNFREQTYVKDAEQYTKKYVITHLV